MIAFQAKVELNGCRVAIILSDDFEQAGATAVLISPKPGQVTGMNHDTKADTFKVAALRI